MNHPPETTPAATLRMDVWSDYACPYCYLELVEIDALQRRFGAALHIVWRTFELRPAPLPLLDPASDYIRDAWTRSVLPLAEQRGLVMRAPPHNGRTRRAHEAAAYARARGQFNDFHHALFKARFVDGRDIDQVQVLCEVAQACGLDGDDLAMALAEQRNGFEVDEDIKLARELGLSGVPLMVVRRPGQDWDQARAVQGAVSLSVLEQVLTETDNRLFAPMR